MQVKPRDNELWHCPRTVMEAVMTIPMPVPTWILVADAGRAHVLEIRTRNDHPIEVPDFDLVAEDTHGFARDLKSDRPGRAFAGGDSARRAAMEPHHDPHQMAKDRFAGRIAARINTAFAGKRFSQLAIVAPPHFLGVLRTELNDAVRDATVAEIDKDLVKSDRDTILRQVQSKLS
jgi:protein required for attachment to host cells